MSEPQTEKTSSRNQYEPCGTPGCNCHILAMQGQSVASEMQKQVATQMQAKGFPTTDIAVVLHTAGVHILGTMAYNVALNGGSATEFLEDIATQIKNEFLYLGTKGESEMGFRKGFGPKGSENGNAN